MCVCIFVLLPLFRFIHCIRLCSLTSIQYHNFFLYLTIFYFGDFNFHTHLIRKKCTFFVCVGSFCMRKSAAAVIVVIVVGRRKSQCLYGMKATRFSFQIYRYAFWVFGKLWEIRFSLLLAHISFVRVECRYNWYLHVHIQYLIYMNVSFA